MKELNEIRSQYNEAQKSFETERTAWINDKKTLEDTIVDMSTSEKHSESDRSSREQELRSLEDRAKVRQLFELGLFLCLTGYSRLLKSDTRTRLLLMLNP